MCQQGASSVKVLYGQICLVHRKKCLHPPCIQNIYRTLMFSIAICKLELGPSYSRIVIYFSQRMCVYWNGYRYS